MTSKISSCLLWWISNHFQNQSSDPFTLTGRAMCCRPTPAATDTTPGTTTGTTPVAHKQGSWAKRSKPWDFDGFLHVFCLYDTCWMPFFKKKSRKAVKLHGSRTLLQKLWENPRLQHLHLLFRIYGSFVGWHLDKWFCGSFGKGKVTSSSLSRGNSECHM